MVSAEIKLPINNVINTFFTTGSNESTAPSSDHSSSDQEMRHLPSITPPSDITTVGRPDNSTVPRIFMNTNGDIPLPSTRINKNSFIQDLILENRAEVQSKNKRRPIIKT